MKKNEKEKQYENLKLLIYEISDAVAKKYVDALLESGLPEELKRELSSRLPTGVASEEILSNFPLYLGEPRLDLEVLSQKD